MGGPGQLPQRTVPALLAKLAEASKFKSNFISFLAPLLRNTPMKIYFVLTRYQSNAKRVFFPLSRPQEFLIYFLFLFCNRANLKRSLPVSCAFLQQPFQHRLISWLRTKPAEKGPLRHLGSPNWKCRWCRGWWFCNQPATSFLSLSLFIQWVLPILRKTKKQRYDEGTGQSFRAKHLPKDQFPQKERGRWNERSFTLGAKR